MGINSVIATFIIYASISSLQCKCRRQILMQTQELKQSGFDWSLYEKQMKQAFNNFTFLTHSKEAQYEALSYKQFGQKAFEQQYVLQGRQYFIISIGSSSTQAFIVRNNMHHHTIQVIPNKYLLYDVRTIGAMLDNQPKDVQQFLFNIKLIRYGVFGATPSKIIMVNAIGYGVNDIRSKEVGEECMKHNKQFLDVGYGTNGALTSVDKPAAKLIHQIHNAAHSLQLKVYIQPRLEPKIETSWAKYWAFTLEENEGVIDIGGGQSLNVYYKIANDTMLHGEIPKEVKPESGINELFDGRGSEKYVTDEIVRRVQIAIETLDIDKKPDLKRFEVGQTGKMRDTYYLSMDF